MEPIEHRVESQEKRCRKVSEVTIFFNRGLINHSNNTSLDMNDNNNIEVPQVQPVDEEICQSIDAANDYADGPSLFTDGDLNQGDLQAIMKRMERLEAVDESLREDITWYKQDAEIMKKTYTHLTTEFDLLKYNMAMIPDKSSEIEELKVKVDDSVTMLKDEVGRNSYELNILDTKHQESLTELHQLKVDLESTLLRVVHQSPVGEGKGENTTLNDAAKIVQDLKIENEALKMKLYDLECRTVNLEQNVNASGTNKNKKKTCCQIFLSIVCCCCYRH